MASFKIKPLSLKGITVSIEEANGAVISPPASLGLGESMDFEITDGQVLIVEETPEEDE